LLGDRATFVDATGRATALLGDAIGANLFLLGCAFQQGLIPLSLEAIDRAIELNGAAVTMNRRAFAWGRLQAHDPAQIEALLEDDTALSPETADDVVADRRMRLVAYQNENYAARFLRTIDKVRVAEVAARR